MFAPKELAARTSSPTVVALGDLGLGLDDPTPGHGRCIHVDSEWVLESFSDADWSWNRDHRRSTSCGIDLLNGVLAMEAAEVRRPYLFPVASQSFTVW